MNLYHDFGLWPRVDFDLTTVFDVLARGLVPLELVTNDSMEERHSMATIKLDSNWPFGTDESTDMRFKIESHVPLPGRIGGRKISDETKEVIDVLKALEPGQSFEIPATGSELKYEARRISSIRQHYVKDRKFTMRTTATGVRIWRLE